VQKQSGESILFTLIEEEISILKSLLKEYPEDSSPSLCHDSLQITSYWMKHSALPYDTDNEKKAEEASITFLQRLHFYDETIDEIIAEIEQSPARCQKRDQIKKHLKTIGDLRRKELSTVIASVDQAKDHIPEKDEKDRRKIIFEETRKLWEQVQEDFAVLKKAMIEMKNAGQWQGQNNDAGDSWAFWNISEQKRSAIRTRASQRAQSYVQDFVQEIERELYTPLLEEHNKILSELKQLPEGQTKSFQRSFEKTEGLGILTDSATQEITIQEEKFREKEDEKQKNIITQYSDITIKNEQEKAFALDLKKLKTRIKQEEFITEFDDALTHSTIHSLEPFHQSLLETTPLLETQAEALESMVNKQQVF